MKLLLARHPDRLDARHPILIEEFLAVAAEGKIQALSMMIGMLADFHHEGRSCRYLQSMKGAPIWELKSASRGGEKGGSRVYLFMTRDDQAAVVNCEVKEGDQPSMRKLKVVLEVIDAFKRGVPVLDGSRSQGR